VALITHKEMRYRTSTSFLHLSGLWAIAVAQPLFDLLGRAPEFFVAHRADALDLLTFSVVLLVVPAAAFASVVAVAFVAGPRCGSAALTTAVSILVACVAVQAGYKAGITGWPGTIAVAVAAVSVAAALYVRVAIFRTFLTMLSSATIIVAVAFMMAPGVRPLFWRAGTEVLGPLPLASTTTVVLLVFDELPLVSLLDEKGELDSRRYPHLARLAADGIWFRTATTVSDYTRWAVPAILSGRYPTARSTPLANQYPRTLFTLLGQSHRMEVFESITALCPADLCKEDSEPRGTRLAAMARDVAVVTAHILLPPETRASLPSLTVNWAGFGAAAVPDDRRGPDQMHLWRRTRKRGVNQDHATSARNFIDGIAPTDPQPTLYFMHTLASHHPPRWLPTGQAISSPQQVVGLSKKDGKTDVWTRDPWPPAQFYQGHLVQAGFVDTLVGRTVTRLKEAGLYERTLFVVTSDHGVSFRPGDQFRSVSEANAGEILPVPLIMKLPLNGQRVLDRAASARAVESVDILPTIADALGIRLPWQVEGVSAIGSIEGKQQHRAYIDDARTVRRFDAGDIRARLTSALERRVMLFGTGVWPLPRLDGLEALVGRSIDSLLVSPATGGLSVYVDRLFALRRVRLEGPTLPVQAVGRLDPAARVTGQPARLAVALNGTIAATTRTWTGQGGWMAMLPPDRLREGENTLEVFLIDPAAPHRLTRLPLIQQSPFGINLLFADYDKWGVEQEGLLQSEKSDGTWQRSTEGSMLMVVPLGAEQPAWLRLELRSPEPGGNQLRVFVDDCVVLARTMSSGQWSADIPLGRCRPSGRTMKIRIASETSQQGREPHPVGFALSRVSIR
jgi:hypothetical protein